MKLLAPVVAFGLALAGCGSNPQGETNIRDLRIEVPAADPAYLDFVTNEAIIQPGEDKMFCRDFVYDGPDIAYSDIITMQGKFGHHLIPLAKPATSPVKEDYDCSKMTNFEPLTIPLGDKYPEGFGTFLPKGKVVVLQMHYVNTSSTPIRVRDVLRLKKKDISTVTNWTSALITANSEIVIAPGERDHKMVFDCTVPKDFDALMLGGHMHENGASFKMEIGPDADHLTAQYSVDQWKPEYRDSPPVNLYLTKPFKIMAGSLIRTTCVWNNTTDKEIKFPTDMCIGVGVVAGTKDPWVCYHGPPSPAE